MCDEYYAETQIRDRFGTNPQKPRDLRNLGSVYESTTLLIKCYEENFFKAGVSQIFKKLLKYDEICREWQTSRIIRDTGAVRN